MTEAQEIALLANVKSLTDHMTMVDEVFRQARMGRDMTLAFVCGHSRLLLPGDYVKEWGKKYGIGLGPSPVSEVLDSEYDVDPPAITNHTRSIEQIMHPLRVSCAQVDFDLVETSLLDPRNGTAAILAQDDPYLDARARVVRSKQLVNPRGRLQLMQTAWVQAGRKL